MYQALPLDFSWTTTQIELLQWDSIVVLEVLNEKWKKIPSWTEAADKKDIFPAAVYLWDEQINDCNIHYIRA